MKIGPIFVFAANLCFLYQAQTNWKKKLKRDVRYPGPVLRYIFECFTMGTCM